MPKLDAAEEREDSLESWLVYVENGEENNRGGGEGPVRAAHPVQLNPSHTRLP